MDDLEQALKTLADRPDFQTLVTWIRELREGYISDLAHQQVASNPHLLSHLAGSISCADLILKQIDESGSGRTD